MLCHNSLELIFALMIEGLKLSTPIVLGDSFSRDCRREERTSCSVLRDMTIKSSVCSGGKAKS